MKIALASDERTALTDFVRDELDRRGHRVVSRLPEPGETIPYPEVGVWVGEAVAGGEADQGVLFCWTGTGVSIAANKVPGIRAALCGDGETARGARLWNDANVLVMSLRATSEAVAKEILDQWLATGPAESGDDRVAIERLKALDIQHRSPSAPALPEPAQSEPAQ